LSSPNHSPYQDKVDQWSSHMLIRSLLIQLPEGARVLDVGTATGTLGRMCQNVGITLNGIEPNSEWADIAWPYYHRLLTTYIENSPEDFLSGYEAIICADVLEHMAYPEAALNRLVSLQPYGCRFLISVPNIANIWVRLNLLFGKFEYADRGILDRTHLRFFTQKTFIEMIRSLGLTINNIYTTPIPISLVFPKIQERVWGYAVQKQLNQLTQMMPKILGYQFLADTVKTYHD